MGAGQGWGGGEVYGRGMGKRLGKAANWRKGQVKHHLDQVSCFLTSFSFLLLILPKDTNYLQGASRGIWVPKVSRFPNGTDSRSSRF